MLLMVLNAEEEGKPLAEVAGLDVADFYFGIFVFVFGGGGVLREIDEGFAGEEFTFFFAGREFLVFLGSVILVFEFDGVDFEFE